jgi:integrase
MINIKYILQGKGNVFIRVFYGRNLDLKKRLNIFCEEKNWDKRYEKIKNVIAVPGHDEINRKLSKLKIYIAEKYNLDYINGEVIDSIWLEKQIDIVFNRENIVDKTTKKQNKHLIYFVDFAYWWIENQAPKWVTSKNAVIDKRAVDQYLSSIHLFERFDKKVKIKEIDSELLSKYANWLSQENYAEQTIKRHLNRVKFFINRAETFDISINKSFTNKIIFDTSKYTYLVEPYLNELEIELIYKLNLDKDSTLDNVRDNFIIGLFTGLRISDFNNLNINNLDKDYIDVKTKKTGAWVSIPLHPYIKNIIKKRNGELPTSVSDAKFNLYIKEICRKCKIDEPTNGVLFDAETKRNKEGVYKKYQLVSSHICRRSFATNLYGHVPNYIIQAVGGWASESMMLHYIKKSNREHADVLKNHWAKQFKNINNE